MKRVYAAILLVFAFLLIYVVIRNANRTHAMPYFSVQRWQDDSKRNWAHYSICNPARLDCLVTIEAAKHEVTNFVVLGADSFSVDVLETTLYSNREVVITGTFETQTSLPRRLMWATGLWRKDGAVFGRNSNKFVLTESSPNKQKCN